MKNILNSIRTRLYNILYKNKTFKSEEEFYTHFFTKNPSWNSPEPNEDESLRWKEIGEMIEKCGIRTGGLKILEIGCGRGWLCQKLRKYGTPTGIEPVSGVIKYAKKIFPGIEFHAMLPSQYLEDHPGRKFDLVVSSEVLEHATNKSQFIAEAAKMLKPGGHILLTTPRAEHYQDFIRFYGEDSKQPVEEWVSEKEVLQLFSENGFEPIGKKFFSPLSGNHPEILMTQLWMCRKNTTA